MVDFLKWRQLQDSGILKPDKHEKGKAIVRVTVVICKLATEGGQQFHVHGIFKLQQRDEDCFVARTLSVLQVRHVLLHACPVFICQSFFNKGRRHHTKHDREVPKLGQQKRVL